jgi:hypothetical protein
MNLGLALRVLGERDRSTARLSEAVAALREALKENTRERVPLDWAGTQLNLGGALLRLGEQQSGTARLEEAPPTARLSPGLSLSDMHFSSGVVASCGESNDVHDEVTASCG